ncbi:hypothetical protein BVC71_02625 [Marivivens niveibacter]|uniref:Uncharacterized protein n=1 Tax=Marivivens niveibacter TaxID=1930667 RepID=A0A251X150_9RHOB|nr:glycosyltransferase [Marivivens niveibacter]OUD10417.1 hypothetical protein BVC71_02625 [Marivivens niveibacter]
MQHVDWTTIKSAKQAGPTTALGRELLRRGFGSATRICDIEHRANRCGDHVPTALRRSLSVPPSVFTDIQSTLYQSDRIDLKNTPPDLRLLSEFGVLNCLTRGIMPWRRVSGEVVVLTAKPEEFDKHLPDLTEIFGPVRMTICPLADIERALCANGVTELRLAAETKVSADQSCRDWNTRRAGLIVGMCAVLIAILLMIWPVWTTFAVIAFPIFWTCVNTALKALTLLGKPPDYLPSAPIKLPEKLPIVTIMLPMYRESEIATRLIDRVSALDYPPELLDVCLLLEEDDHMTRLALKSANLPRFMRAIVVPHGALKTKPRAMNYGLNFARGSIIGIYDAEDAPETDQIKRVVSTFAQCSSRVACLQGRLDFYNARTNWMSRCFTMEYATWFRVILPGLERLGLVIPLGGTTLFFRKHILETLGGWDAHNVTEDADLGIRLARAGFETRIVRTTTYEEANCRPWPWVKQRSRWLKGYAITYGVHMRRPSQLLRDLGLRKFLGLQVQFLGALCQFVTAPLLWSLWLIPFGIWHPVSSVLPDAAITALALIFIGCEAVNIFAAWRGINAADRRWLAVWIPTLQFYFPLASLAAYKGLWELLHSPFYWDKTSHGIFDKH